MLFGGLLFGGADVVYRHFYPGRVALENFLKPAGFFTREGSKALYIGYLVALVHLGWIVLYYLLGEKFSFWCPSGIDSVEVLSATVPFYSAVSLGLHAASQEETVARIVGLSLAWKATGRFWLANLFQAVIWAFMHSSYPQQPCFARGVELTVVGLFYGFVLRRYGLLPCFIGHYLLDAFLDVKPLLSVGPGQLWLWLSSFIPLVPFLLLFFLSLFVTRLRADSPQVDGETSVHETGDAALTNEAVSKSFGTTVATATPVGDSVQDVYVYNGFSRRFRLIAGITSLVLLAITFFIHLPTCGDDARCQIGREQAVTRARLILQKAGINVKNHFNLGTSAGGWLNAH
ncbi:MAG TPA: CPBP family intramembrane metalloprotease [Candidatus Obscuribacter sp.]|nr:CPBP family intramembrane metalloprotease [Candidatus Obscuribacter sp.]